MTQNKDFQRVYSRGQSFVSPTLVTYVCRNKKKATRIGITTSKKIGKAIKRNRARRVIKEAFYQVQANVNTGLDIVFVARGKTPQVKTKDVLKVMEDHLEKARILKSL